MIQTAPAPDVRLNPSSLPAAAASFVPLLHVEQPQAHTRRQRFVIRVRPCLGSLFSLALGLVLLVSSALLPAAAHAQIGLGSAVDLALRSSPKVKMAEADVKKAHAALAQAKAAFVPVITANGGYGTSTGVPLGVPTIFNFSAQSLGFNFSQIDYIRSARASVESAEHALNEARIEVAEDVTSTYVTLDNALTRRDVMRQQADIAAQLVKVASDRADMGVDARMEVTRAKHTAAQIKLQALLVDDEIDTQAEHLSVLTGLPARALVTDHGSIPRFQPVTETSSNDAASSEGVLAAEFAAKARQEAAFGDKRYMLRPQIGLSANYARITTRTSNYELYYPCFVGGEPSCPQRHSLNSLGLGVQLTLPLLDMAQHERSKVTAADALHDAALAQQQRDLFREGRLKLRHGALELQARQEMATLDQELAQEQLESIQIQINSQTPNTGGGPLLNPKDELNARLQERQRYYDLLAAQLSLQTTQVNLLRQGGSLGQWIHGSIVPTPTPAPIPGAAPAPQTNTPAVPGTPPDQAAPSSTGAPGNMPSTPTPQPR